MLYINVITKLTDSRVFPTVEKRWAELHPTHLESLPTGEELLQSLATELGLLQPTSFKMSRDSCQKKLQAPLFWIPYSSTATSAYWPVVIIESRSRILCAVPFLDRVEPVNEKTTTTEWYSYHGCKTISIF